jgi:hypothetical protein
MVFYVSASTDTAFGSKEAAEMRGAEATLLIVNVSDVPLQGHRGPCLHASSQPHISRGLATHVARLMHVLDCEMQD